MARIRDLDGDGHAEIPVASPWGVGILKLSGSTLSAPMMARNGTRFGDWLLNTADNQCGPLGDFDGDGKTEVLVTSPWGLGIWKLSGSTLSSPMMAPNGTRFGGWLLNTADNHFEVTADFDGDGKSEILVTSPWGVGILKLSGSTLSAPMMAANGTRFGGWLLNTADNHLRIAADFDGDGKTEILVTSPWGIGILKQTGDTLSPLVMAPNGTRFGGWLLNTADNRFEMAADFDGDGKSEILVTSPWGAGILKLAGSTLSAPMMAANGTRFGGWLLNTADNRLNIAADFDGDGKSEILATSPWGIGILKLSGSTLSAPMMAQNGTRFGGWLLNTGDNRLNIAADFDGDGKSELLVTSPWGVGILKLSGSTLSALMMAANGTRFGGWLLNTADNDLELGNWRAYAVIIYHNDWGGTVQETQNKLQVRGYAVDVTDKGSAGLSLIKAKALTLKTGDRLLVYLAGHGSDPRGGAKKWGNMDKAISLDHFVQFNQGELYVKQTAPLFKALGEMGIDLTVIDGSCNGGETVLYATGEKYCAVATTSVYAPSLTGFPNPAAAITKEHEPSTFGFWWERPHRMASWLNGDIVLHVPERESQRLYRNDDTDFSRHSLFFRPAVDTLKALDLGGWNLRYQYCYLFKYIYPDDYNALSDAEKSKYTHDTQTFIDTMNGIMDPQRPLIATLKSRLNDAALMNKAADVYGGEIASAWQTLANDSEWDPLGNPTKHSADMYDLLPSAYLGSAGFKGVAGQLLVYITLMERCWEDQEALLWKIDAAVKASIAPTLIPTLDHLELAPRLPHTHEEYEQYNAHDLAVSKRCKALQSRKRFERPQLAQALARVVPGDSGLDKREAKNILDSSVMRFKDEFVLRDAPSPALADLVAQFKAISVEHRLYLGRSSFLLSLVEDAVCKVQSVDTGRYNPGDLVLY